MNESEGNVLRAVRVGGCQEALSRVADGFDEAADILGDDILSEACRQASDALRSAAVADADQRGWSVCMVLRSMGIHPST